MLIFICLLMLHNWQPFIFITQKLSVVGQLQEISNKTFYSDLNNNIRAWMDFIIFFGPNLVTIQNYLRRDFNSYMVLYFTLGGWDLNLIRNVSLCMCVWCECVYECMVNVCLCICMHKHMRCQPCVLMCQCSCPQPLSHSCLCSVEARLNFLFCEPGSQG